MASVINIFTKQPVEIPAAAQSDYVADREADLGDLMAYVQGMEQARTEEDFRDQARGVKQILVRWGI